MRAQLAEADAILRDTHRPEPSAAHYDYLARYPTPLAGGKKP
jgi:hypothetical protein